MGNNFLTKTRFLPKGCTDLLSLWSLTHSSGRSKAQVQTWRSEEEVEAGRGPTQEECSPGPHGRFSFRWMKNSRAPSHASYTTSDSFAGYGCRSTVILPWRFFFSKMIWMYMVHSVEPPHGATLECGHYVLDDGMCSQIGCIQADQVRRLLKM